jgi:hypothetical protein
VSERTIRRYAVALHDIGIPVDGQPGLGGGYRLRPGSRFPPLMLSDAEADAVAFGLMLAEQRGLAGAREAPAKITRVLPDRLTRRVARLRNELSFLGEPDPAPASSETLLLIAEAIQRRRSLRIGYVRADGMESTREIDPLGLVARHGRWYVPARDRGREDLRTFRADRITHATIGEPAAPAEPGFDPAAYVVEMLARLPWPGRSRSASTPRSARSSHSCRRRSRSLRRTAPVHASSSAPTRWSGRPGCSPDSGSISPSSGRTSSGSTSRSSPEGSLRAPFDPTLPGVHVLGAGEILRDLPDMARRIAEAGGAHAPGPIHRAVEGDAACVELGASCIRVGNASGELKARPSLRAADRSGLDELARRRDPEQVDDRVVEVEGRRVLVVVE